MSTTVERTPEEWEAFRQEQRRVADIEFEQRHIASTLSVIPARYQDAEVTNDDVKSWIEVFAADPEKSPGLLLTGPTGVGKTFEAYGALKAVVRLFPWTSIVAGSTPALLASARPGAPIKRRGSEAHGWHDIDPIEEMCSARLLLLDDLGAEKASEWTGEILYRVLDDRYQRMAPTIVVSNLPPRELAGTVGDRIASRLTEMCRTVVVKGSDRRRQVQR